MAKIPPIERKVDVKVTYMNNSPQKLHFYAEDEFGKMQYLGEKIYPTMVLASGELGAV